MELPDKKPWPGYYNVIRKPQCFENIFVRVSRCQRSTLSHLFTSEKLASCGVPSVSTLSKDVRFEFNSEESQIQEDAQTVKVCSIEAVVYALWEAEPAVIVLLTSAYVRSPCTIISSRVSSFDWDLQDHAEASRHQGRLGPYDERYGIYPKGWSVMLRVPGLPKGTSATTTQRQQSPRLQLRSQSRPPGRGYRRKKRRQSDQHQFSSLRRHRRLVNYYNNHCDPCGSDNLDDNSCSNDKSTGRDGAQGGNSRWRSRGGGRRGCEEKEAEEAHEDDGDYEARCSAVKRGAKGKRKVRTKERPGDRRKSGLRLPLRPLSHRRPRQSRR